MFDDKTKTADGLEPAPAAAQILHPMLSVVHHSDPEFRGNRHVLNKDGSLTLGRGSRAFGSGALDDTRVSQHHLAVVRKGESILVRDLGSHNGTMVNGKAIEEQQLSSGDVVSFGPVMLLHHWGRRALPVAIEGSDLVATSSAMADVLEQVELLAGETATALIQGETGAGKEVIAREIHRRSGRAGELVAINCGAVADGVLSSELFGHARGAFSGAGQERTGLVATATGGTLLLDEIGDASAAMQASLLRLLDKREYRRVGEDQTRSSDARFLAATHVPLEELAAAGHFREDLLARLNRWTVHVPALRQRREDIMPLTWAFLMSRLGGQANPSAALTLALVRYDWPKNVRELHSVVEQAAVESRGSLQIALTQRVASRLRLRSDPDVAPPSPISVPGQPTTSPRQRPSRPTAAEITQLFSEVEGNARALASRLDVSRATLYRWIGELGLSMQQLREARDASGHGSAAKGKRRG